MVNAKPTKYHHPFISNIDIIMEECFKYTQYTVRNYIHRSRYRGCRPLFWNYSAGYSWERQFQRVKIIQLHVLGEWGHTCNRIKAKFNYGLMWIPKKISAAHSGFVELPVNTPQHVTIIILWTRDVQKGSVRAWRASILKYVWDSSVMENGIRWQQI